MILVVWLDRMLDVQGRTAPAHIPSSGLRRVVRVGWELGGDVRRETCRLRLDFHALRREGASVVRSAQRPHQNVFDPSALWLFYLSPS